LDFCSRLLSFPAVYKKSIGRPQARASRFACSFSRAQWRFGRFCCGAGSVLPFNPQKNGTQIDDSTFASLAPAHFCRAAFLAAAHSPGWLAFPSSFAAYGSFVAMSYQYAAIG
jgi:hypothetical protein